MSFWIPAAESPVILQPTTLNLMGVENVSQSQRVYTFQIEGPPHMGVFLSPAENMILRNWTYLENQVPESGPRWQNERDTYFIFFNYGSGWGTPFEFNVTIEVAEGSEVSTDGKKWVDIALVSHYLFHQEQRTEAFQGLIDTFPEWAYVQAWSSTYESWQF